MKIPPLRRQHGFSLVELMVTIVVAGILVALAVPAFSNYILNQRIRNASFDFVSALSFARSEAVKRNVSISVQRSGTAWGGGWSVVIASDGTLIKSWGPYSNLAVVPDDSTLASISYRYDGRLTPAASVSFEIDDSQSNTSVAPRCVTIDLTGRPNSQQGACP